MSAEIASEIWSELKRYISSVDRTEAADGLVAVLVDNDFDAADIKAAFKGDEDVRKALQSYLDDDEPDSDELYDEDFDEEEY